RERQQPAVVGAESGVLGEEESPGLTARDGLGRPLPELARTGTASTAWTAWTGAAAGALLLAGAALLRYAHRARRAGG
ncbi:LPXTG cell wall anchor domain-containing protein, partial [Streptomyces durocortorensis]